MGNYDLDEKVSFSLSNLFNSKNVSKVVPLGTGVELKHFKMFDYINALVAECNSDTIKLEVKEFLNETLIFPEDHVVVNYSDARELYVLSGTISRVFSVNPLILNVFINSIEKMNNLRKYQRFYVSLTANIKVAGYRNPIFAVVKNLSSGGIKVNCNEKLIPEDILDVEVILDRTNTLSFKGAVVRKNKIKDYYEYGIEIQGMSESNIKCLYHYLKWLDSYSK